MIASNKINYFELFALPIQLNLDEESLRQTFYQLSRTFHPDAVSEEKADIANQTSALLNSAYQTLKNRTTRSQYVLEISGKKPNPSKVPVELAEQYFELQDLLSDNQNEILAHFKKNLENLLSGNSQEWTEIAQEFDDKGSSESLLIRLEENLLKARYIRSMLADIETKPHSTSKGDLWQ